MLLTVREFREWVEVGLEGFVSDLGADYDLRIAERTTSLKAEPRVRVHSQ